jgi:rhodanese-related sulfurtransferase
MAELKKTASDLVAQAKSRIENLSVEQVAEELAQGQALVIDIREAEERVVDGAIPGTVHAPRGMLEFYADPSSRFHRPEFDPQRRIILHCSAGGRSALAAATLLDMGYTDVAHLESGFEGWRQAGKPIETE